MRPEQVLLFAALKPAHVAFCWVGLVVSLACILIAPAIWYAVTLVAAFFVLILLARLVVGGYADQDRALTVFGRCWCGATFLGCASFVSGNTAYLLCVDVPAPAVWALAGVTSLVPVYMLLSGTFFSQRMLNHSMIASAFYLSPQWAVMPHLTACFIMAAALFVGEMMGTALQATFGAWLLANRKGAHRVRGADADLAAQVWGEDSSFADPTDDVHNMAQLQRWLTAPGNCSLSEVRIDPVSLCFDSAKVELFYAARMFQLGNTRHYYACALAGCICAIGGMSSVAMWPVAAVVVPYVCALALGRKRLQGWASVPDAQVAFCSWATSAGTAAGAVYIAGTLAGLSDSLSAACAPLLRHLQQRYRVLTLVAGLDEDDSPDSLTLLCLCMLLILCGVYLRVTVLTPSAKMGLRCVLLACVVASHTDVARHDLSPNFVSSTVLAVCFLALGELVGYSIEHLRRTLFQGWLLESQAAEKATAAAAAAAKADQAQARQIEEKDAELAADKRLNHVIKGRCGSAIAAISTFRMMVGPYLRCELPEELELMLKAPLVHLTEAVEWCHRRQVFVQLASGTYVSHRTPVDVVALLERCLGALGSDVSSTFAHPLAVDVTVLKVALDEILSNALKYRKLRSKIHVSASFAFGELTLKVTNRNRPGMPHLSPEECKRVMQAGYKSHMASAVSDGLGLDSLAIAVAAAGGGAELSSDAEAAITTVHVRLPADAVRHGSHVDMDLSSCNGLYAMRGVSSHPSSAPSSAGSSKKWSPVHPEARPATRPLHRRPLFRQVSAAGRPMRDEVEPRRAASAGTSPFVTHRDRWHDASPKQPLHHLDRIRRTSRNGRRGAAGVAPPPGAEDAGGLYGPLYADPSAAGLALSTTAASSQHNSVVRFATGTTSALTPPTAFPAASAATGSSSPAMACHPWATSPAVACRPWTDNQWQGGFTDFGPAPTPRGWAGGWEGSGRHPSREHPFASTRPSPLCTTSPPAGDAQSPAAEGGPAQRASGASQSGSPGAGWRAYPRAARGWTRRLTEDGVGTEQAAPRRRRSLTPTVLARSAGSSDAVIPDRTLRAGSSDAVIPDRTLRCCGIDDEGMPRMVLSLICEHYLCAKTAVLLGETSEQVAAFVDVVMGKREAVDLSPTTDPPGQRFDVVFLDQNIDLRATPPVLGSNLCLQLRSAGFTGITVVLSGAPSAQIEEMRLLPQVDLAYEKGFALPSIALAIKTLYAERHNARPELPRLDAPRARSNSFEADWRHVLHKTAAGRYRDGAPETDSMVIGRSAH